MPILFGSELSWVTWATPASKNEAYITLLIALCWNWSYGSPDCTGCWKMEGSVEYLENSTIQAKGEQNFEKVFGRKGAGISQAAVEEWREVADTQDGWIAWAKHRGSLLAFFFFLLELSKKQKVGRNFVGKADAQSQKWFLGHAKTKNKKKGLYLIGSEESLLTQASKHRCKL